MEPRRPTPRRPRLGSRALRALSAALIASALVAGIAWAWSASTVNTASVTADTLGTPGSPGAARATGTGQVCTTINVTWNAVPNATGYRIERDVNGTWVEIEPNDAASPYVDSGTFSSVEIQYRISAKFENWLSPTPALASVACGIGDVDDLSATFASNCTSTTLNWTAPINGTVPAGAVSYNVQRRINGGAWANTTTPSGLGVTATTFTDNTTTPTYAPHNKIEYQVIARNGATVGTGSNIVEATTDWACLVAPTNMAATGLCTLSNTVSWAAAPSPVSSYNIQRSVNAGGSWAAFTGSTGVTGTSVTDATSTLGQAVIYRALSRNGTIVDTVASASTATVYAGFYARSVQFGGDGDGVLEPDETITITFSQPLSLTAAPNGGVRAVATGGTRGLWIAATGTTAATIHIGALVASSNNQFGAGNATGTWSPDATRTVWTWEATAGGGATMVAVPAISGWTLPNSAGEVLCSNNSTQLQAVTPTRSGRW